MALTGIPIIAFNHCDIKEIVINNETGILVEEKDTEGLCKGVEKLISEKNLVDKITNNARILVENARLITTIQVLNCCNIISICTFFQ